MKLPLSWIKDYTDVSDISYKEYEHALTMSGSKVEGFVDMGGDINNVKTGKIIKIETDILKGNVISIEYKDKIIVSYCNIDICDGINIGDDVTQGMLIGYINNNPPFESEQELHLHMEIFKNNVLSDLNIIELK